MWILPNTSSAANQLDGALSGAAPGNGETAELVRIVELLRANAAACPASESPSAKEVARHRLLAAVHVAARRKNATAPQNRVRAVVLSGAAVAGAGLVVAGAGDGLSPVGERLARITGLHQTAAPGAREYVVEGTISGLRRLPTGEMLEVRTRDGVVLLDVTGAGSAETHESLSAIPPHETFPVGSAVRARVLSQEGGARVLSIEVRQPSEPGASQLGNEGSTASGEPGQRPGSELSDNAAHRPSPTPTPPPTRTPIARPSVQPSIPTASSSPPPTRTATAVPSIASPTEVTVVPTRTPSPYPTRTPTGESPEADATRPPNETFDKTQERPAGPDSHGDSEVQSPGSQTNNSSISDAPMR